MRAAIAILIALALGACTDDAPAPEDSHAPVETWQYEFSGHADCNGERDYVITMCFPAGSADAVEPGDAAAAAYADLWLAACDVDHAVLGDTVGASHAGYCANADDTGEDTWSCGITYGPDFVTCDGGAQ
ncbi:MAG TPA: hypothetical protein VGL61_06565 [Kofleriaceae bacterium]